VLLVVSRDVPQVARVKMLEQLAMYLPGGFARIDKGHMDAALMQGNFSVFSVFSVFSRM
jgi:hypothetical protein